AYDRNAPNLLLQDGHTHYTARTFTVEVENGWYLVEVTTGDQTKSRSGLRIVNADTGQVLASDVETAAGQFEVLTFVVLVEDGTLDLTFSSTVATSWWEINSLELRPAQGRFLSMGAGPTVDIDPSVPHLADGQTVDTVTIFGVEPGHLYTVATSLGTIVSADADPHYQGIQIRAYGTSLDVQIQRPFFGGEALLSIVDVTGAKTGLSVLEYEFSALRFDLNSSSNVTASGFLGVGVTNVFTAEKGYGWATNASSYDRAAAGDDLLRDGHWGTNNTFLVQL